MKKLKCIKLECIICNQSKLKEGMHHFFPESDKGICNDCYALKDKVKKLFLFTDLIEGVARSVQIKEERLQTYDSAVEYIKNYEDGE